MYDCKAIQISSSEKLDFVRINFDITCNASSRRVDSWKVLVPNGVHNVYLRFDVTFLVYRKNVTQDCDVLVPVVFVDSDWISDKDF